MPPPDTLLQLLLIGLTNGAVIALNAIAVTLVYGVVRTLNLAHGDLFGLTTIVVTTLVAALGLSLARPPVEQAGGLLLCLAAAALFGAALSGLIERLAFRPFRGAGGSVGGLAPLLATLGLSFVLYQSALIWRFYLPNWIPGEHRSVPGIPELPRDSIPEVLPATVLWAGPGRFTLTVKEGLVLGLALACALGVWVFLQRTRTGRAIRAVAQNAELARLVGINPETAIRDAFWLGGALAGVAAFVFATYYTHPFANAGAQSGLTAFAAALLGGVGNPLSALLAGLVLGVGAAGSDYFWQARWTPVLLQGLLIGLLLLRPTGLLASGEEAALTEDGALGRSRPGRWTPASRRLALGLLLLGALYPWLDAGLGWHRASTMTSLAIYALLALGLNLLLGVAGLLDLGYAVSFGLGGYVAALVSSPPTGGRVDFIFVLAASAAAAGLYGALAGPLTRRLGRNYLAIVTLALGQMAQQTLVNLGGLTSTGGSLAAIPAPTLFTIALASPVARYYLAFGLAALAAFGSWRLIRSRVGRAWLAASEDETAAASHGIDPGRYRALAFVVSAAIAGAAGALYATSFSYIDTGAVDFRLSAMVLAMVILGGAGSVPGAVAGALVIGAYDVIVIPLLGGLLAQFQTGDLRFGSAFDARGLSYLNFGLALYLTVWLRARRRR